MGTRRGRAGTPTLSCQGVGPTATPTACLGARRGVGGPDTTRLPRAAKLHHDEGSARYLLALSAEPKWPWTHTRNRALQRG